MNSDLQKWEDAAAGWDQDIAQEHTYRTLLITEALDQLLQNMENQTVLDAGCGNGYFSNWLKNRGAKVVGVDGAAKMVELAKQKYPAIKFEVHDLLQPTGFKDSSFDTILANMLLMHLEDIGTFLTEAKRILSPNGKLIFSVLHPAFNQPTSQLYKSWWDKLTFAKPKSLAFDYYAHETGRYESHFKKNLTHYHRTIEEYSHALFQTGLKIERILEPHKLPGTFLKSHPKLEYATRLPRFIFFVAIN